MNRCCRAGSSGAARDHHRDRWCPGIAAAKPEPDLVLMDMSLPVLDGWEATRELKAEPLTCGIPVIGLSAHAMAGDRERAIEVGCDDYDTKPVELPRLLRKIEALLARNSERS